MNIVRSESLKLIKEIFDSIPDEQFYKEYLEIMLNQNDAVIKSQNEVIVQLCKEKCAIQAKIDALMLEHCPEEMTPEQFERLGESQYVSTYSNKGNICL